MNRGEGLEKKKTPSMAGDRCASAPGRRHLRLLHLLSALLHRPQVALPLDGARPRLTVARRPFPPLREDHRALSASVFVLPCGRRRARHPLQWQRRRCCDRGPRGRAVSPACGQRRR
ncbi:histone-lysine N-methyltransferase, H3 lysine-9 specific SUVH6-like [Sesbania bispinosa]|nr:histone-lysine N-methyltransferase, H3 lysine-9 specific SUVH6-like [Sesbania bispinosa]